jgi:hypothetical protein
MSALLVLLVFGGLGFWTAVVITSCVIILCLEKESGTGATVFGLIGLGFIVGFGNLAVFPWILANPLLILGYVLGYLGLGVVYGVFRWWLLLQDRATLYREKRAEWLGDFLSTAAKDEREALEGGGKLTRSALKDWQARVKEYRQKRPPVYLTKPALSRHKGDILAWMTYWPWSGLWLLINDPVRRAFKYVYARISGTLQHMADRIFAEIDNELDD